MLGGRLQRVQSRRSVTGCHFPGGKTPGDVARQTDAGAAAVCRSRCEPGLSLGGRREVTTPFWIPGSRLRHRDQERATQEAAEPAGPISSASLSPLMLFSRTLVNKRLNGCCEGATFAGAGPLTSGAPLGCGHGQPHAQRTHSTARAGPPASGSAARSPAEGAGDGSDNKTWRALCSAVRWEPSRPCYGRRAPRHPALQHQCPL